MDGDEKCLIKLNYSSLVSRRAVDVRTTTKIHHLRFL